MIEEVLVQYGTLGLWVAYMIYKERTYMRDMKNALGENTKTLKKIDFTINKIHPEVMIE